MPIEGHGEQHNILAEKINRNDLDKYTAEFLFRQRAVNEKVIEWSGCVVESSSVLDACAGPEGSYLAVARRGAKWYGNEISLRTAGYLKGSGAETVIGSANAFPFKNDSMDLVVYIFALNNIEDTFGSLNEAKRVLKTNGSVLISDPGQTKWATDLYLYEAMQKDTLPPDLTSILAKSDRFKTQIPDFYSHKSNMTSEKFVSRFLQGLYGITLGDIPAIMAEAKLWGAKMNASQFGREFHEIMEAKYWEHVASVAKVLNFNFKKVGVISASQRNNETDWNVGNVLDLALPETPKKLGEMVLALRNNRHPTSEEVVMPGKKCSKNIIAPAVLFEKYE